mmetsp:Transcript_115711/g.327217  ORF Transcript_115711/g.327217 Transcript_115711/m.327217 type:complete len:121 (+) Transcript_115711:577-939(+)
MATPAPMGGGRLAEEAAEATEEGGFDEEADAEEIDVEDEMDMVYGNTGRCSRPLLASPSRTTGTVTPPLLCGVALVAADQVESIDGASALRHRSMRPLPRSPTATAAAMAKASPTWRPRA